MVLLAGTTADSDRAHNLAVFLEWNAAGKNHDLAIVGGMNPKKLAAGLGMRRQIFRRYVESTRGIGFLNRDVDTPEPCTVHPYVRNQISTCVRHRDVHRLANLFRFLFSGRNNFPSFV